MILNCKVCGGSLKMLDKGSVYKCEYCGKEQTIPQIDDDQIIGMMNRANHFRQVFEFDKAIEIYERLIENGVKDAYVYWALVLCRYGIEYVDDPVTKEKIPTCHRAQYKSILEDADYLMALNISDSLQRALYEKEANYISTVQKGILEISNKEDPFDVFLCYKESDENGKRTPDSVLAQDIYYQLVEKGHKVFFARITLESKLGHQYEPYIFAALNSAKVMIVLGTKPEYYNAVWVKNEWNRFLDLMHNDRSRLIIPAYKDFDPYDLPDELSYFQALDMSKIGFIQDLIRGIDKVLDKSLGSEKIVIHEASVSTNAGGSINALLKRGDLALEDGDWDKAYDYYDQVLNIDAENSNAYLGQALSSIKAKSLESLVDARISIFESKLSQISKENIKVSDDEKYQELMDFIQNNRVLLGASANSNNWMPVNKHVYFESRLKGLDSIIEEEESWFVSDKSLTKAVRFSDDTKKQIQEAKQAVLARMYSEKDSITSAEETLRNDALSVCDNYYEDSKKKINERINQRKQEYETLRNCYYSGDYSSGLKKLQDKIGTYKGYEDADFMLNDISLKLKEKEKELHALKEREHEILFHEFAKIKGFNQEKIDKKRAALQQELDIIQQKIQVFSENL